MRWNAGGTEKWEKMEKTILSKWLGLVFVTVFAVTSAVAKPVVSHIVNAPKPENAIYLGVHEFCKRDAYCEGYRPSWVQKKNRSGRVKVIINGHVRFLRVKVRMTGFKKWTVTVSRP